MPGPRPIGHSRDWIHDHGVPECDVMVAKIQRPLKPLEGDSDWRVEWLAVNGDSGVLRSPQRMKVIMTLSQLKKTRKVWTAEVETVRAFTQMVEDIDNGVNPAAKAARK